MDFYLTNEKGDIVKFTNVQSVPGLNGGNVAGKRSVQFIGDEATLSDQDREMLAELHREREKL